MNKQTIGKYLGTFGSLITIAFGLWHFFIPSIWSWYSYFAEGVDELVLGVRATNFFFSLCMVLLGGLTLLFIWKKIPSDFPLKALLFAMMILWAARVMMQLIYPQGSASAALQYGMLGIFGFTFLSFVVCYVGYGQKSNLLTS